MEHEGFEQFEADLDDDENHHPDGEEAFGVMDFEKANAHEGNHRGDETEPDDAIGQKSPDLLMGIATFQFPIRFPRKVNGEHRDGNAGDQRIDAEANPMGLGRVDENRIAEK